MTMPIQTLRLLVAKGMSPQEILEIAETMVAPKERTANAERQARFRARKKAEREAESVTDNVTSNGVTRNAETEASYGVPPVSPKGDTAPQGAKRTRGSRISPDWKPPTPDQLPPEARKLATQWPEATYRAEAEAFVNYWLAETGAKASKANWNTAWANRIVQIHSKVMRDAKYGNGPAPPKRAEPGSFTDYLASQSP